MAEDVIRITLREPVGAYPDGNGVKWYINGFGKSTVQKPVEGIAQGSWIFETNTKEVKFFDEVSEEWG